MKKTKAGHYKTADGFLVRDVSLIVLSGAEQRRIRAGRGRARYSVQDLRRSWVNREARTLVEARKVIAELRAARKAIAAGPKAKRKTAKRRVKRRRKAIDETIAIAEARVAEWRRKRRLADTKLALWERRLRAAEKRKIAALEERFEKRDRRAFFFEKANEPETKE